MKKDNPIVLVEDDQDDIDILNEIFKELNIKRDIVSFLDTDKAMEYLVTTNQQPFIIFCDINLPRHNGVEFKRNIDEQPFLRRKSIPFVFYSTSAERDIIDEVYTDLTVQGFFTKGISYEEIIDDMRLILEYWRRCHHPNSVNKR